MRKLNSLYVFVKMPSQSKSIFNLDNVNKS